MGKKNITFSDIAKYTGFSKTTISRYFNAPDSLTLENQEIIAEALDKLNYKENKVARILASGKTEFIGVIIPNLYLHYYSEVLNQILKSYDSLGYKFLVFTGDDHKDTERKYIQELLSYKIEGMIIENIHGSRDDFVYLLSYGADRDNGFSGNRRIIKSDNFVVIWKFAVFLNQLVQQNIGKSIIRQKDSLGQTGVFLVYFFEKIFQNPGCLFIAGTSIGKN